MISSFPKTLDKLLHKITAVENVITTWLTDVSTLKDQKQKEIMLPKDLFSECDILKIQLELISDNE